MVVWPLPLLSVFDALDDEFYVAWVAGLLLAVFSGYLLGRRWGGTGGLSRMLVLGWVAAFVPHQVLQWSVALFAWAAFGKVPLAW